MRGGRVHVPAHALALLLLLRCAGPAVGGSMPCQELDRFYSRNSDGSLRPDRELPVYGRARTLRVAEDGRAPSRAAAALLAAAVRSLARYRQVQLMSLPPPLTPPMDAVCALASAMQKYCRVIDTSDEVYDTVLLAPAASWNGGRCKNFEVCLNMMEVPPRLETVGGGAAPARLRLHVHLTSDADAHPDCKDALLWEFYADHTRLYTCSFTRDEKSTLADVYTLSNQRDVLESRIKNANLHLKLITLEDQTRSRSELFRLLKERNYSFLFIDYDMWSDMPGVYTIQPPSSTNESIEMTHDFIWSLRLADDFVLRPLAPQALKALQLFLPSSKDIREVLEIESTKPQLDIEEAACSWAMEHKATFETWYDKDYKPQHRIAVFLCSDDPDKKQYEKVARIVQNLYSSDSELNLGLYFLEIDCRSETKLSNEFIKTSLSYSWPRLLGVVAAGAGARAAAALAPAVQTALLLYDAPAAGRRLLLNSAVSTAIRTASGTPQQLVAAVQDFLSSFRWTRLALISDESELAKDLLDAFRDNRKLKIYNVFTNNNISELLQNLQSLDARIFFVNTSPDVAENIICAAHTLDMTSFVEYVWILREWRGVDLECSAGNVRFKPNISYFSISFWWRGGNHTQFTSQTKAKNILRNALDDLWPERATWPLLAAPLADSLELLIKSFKKFTQLYPEKYFELHGKGAVRLLLDSLQNYSTNGVLQNFEYANGTLSRPFVFLDKWTGPQREPLFMWRAYSDRVQLLTKVNDVYGYNLPSDGSRFCLTNTYASFNSTCNDLVLLVALSCLLIAFFALYLARRVRLKHLAKRDALLTAQLLAQRDFVSDALADHYVDRAALELYDYLSHGCFGRVRYAILRAPERQPISVAVKELRHDVPMTEESELLREACTLAMLNHDHIVRLIGVCATGGPLLVLLEYAFFGNLCKYLCERRHLLERPTGTEENDEVYHVSAPSLTRLAREVASALAYLALQRLVHRDVRASNCLVDARRSLKLADFSLARKTGTGIAGEEEYLTQRRGLFPVLWMAPESLERGVFTAASDAWALGVLFLELVSLGARPYGAWPPQRVLRYVSAGGRPPLPPDISESTQRILVQCWRRAPEARPSAAALLAQLEAPIVLHPALRPAPLPADEECPTIQEDDITIST